MCVCLPEFIIVCVYLCLMDVYNCISVCVCFGDLEGRIRVNVCERMDVCVCVCVYECVCMWLSNSVYFCLSVCLSLLSEYRFVWVNVCLNVSERICLCVSVGVLSFPILVGETLWVPPCSLCETMFLLKPHSQQERFHYRAGRHQILNMTLKGCLVSCHNSEPVNKARFSTLCLPHKRRPFQFITGKRLTQGAPWCRWVDAIMEGSGVVTLDYGDGFPKLRVM